MLVYSLFSRYWGDNNGFRIEEWYYFIGFFFCVLDVKFQFLLFQLRFGLEFFIFYIYKLNFI